MPTITKVSVINDTADVTESGGRRYVFTYQVQTNGTASSTSILGERGSHGLPDRGDVLGSDTNARVVAISVTREDDSHEDFRYEVTFSTERSGQEPQDDPLDDFNDVDWSSAESEEAYFEDVDGVKVLNSIGQQFEELPTRFAADWEVTITSNQASYNIATAESLVGTVNNATLDVSDGETLWQIAAGAALLVEAAPGIIQERNGIWYYRVRYRYKLNPAGWNSSEKYLDYGTYTLDQGEWVPQTDASGNDITERFALNGNGERAAPPDDPAELEFKPYDEANHGVLPLV